MASHAKPPNRGEVWVVDLNPSIGSETRKQHPCLVISADSLSRIPVRIVVPLSGWRSKHDHWPWCIRIQPDLPNGLDKASAADALQVRCLSVEHARFRRRLGKVDSRTLDDVVLAVGLCIQHPSPCP